MAWSRHPEPAGSLTVLKACTSKAPLHTQGVRSDVLLHGSNHSILPAFFNCFECNKISGAYDYIMYVVGKEVPVFPTGNLFKAELILFLGEKGRRGEVRIKWQ